MPIVEIDPEQLAAIRANVMDAIQSMAEVTASQVQHPDSTRDQQFLAGIQAGAETVARVARIQFDVIAQHGHVTVTSD